MKNLYSFLLPPFLFFFLSFNSSLQIVSAMMVDSLELPIADFYTKDTLFCTKGIVHIQNNSFNYQDFIWQVEGADSLKVLEGGDAEVRISQAGRYSITLIAVNECGSDTLTKENQIRVTNSIEAKTTTNYLGYECGIGRKYRFCVESDFQISDYSWLRTCLSEINSGQCCEVGFTHGLFLYENGVYLTSESGCQQFFYAAETYGDWEYVNVEWVSGPVYFCQGEEATIPFGTVACYPPGCTVSYGSIDTSVPGSYAIPAQVHYQTCTKSTNVGVEILAHPDFKKSYDTICVYDYAAIQFNNVVYRPHIYVDGKLATEEPYWLGFSEPGTYEVTATEEGSFEYPAECPSKDTLYLTVLPIPYFELQYQEKICRDTSEYVTIVAEEYDGLPPYSYEWWLNGYPIDTDTKVLVIPITELPNIHNTVFLTVTNSNGCSALELRADFVIDICNDIEEVLMSQFLTYQITPNQLFIKAEKIPVGEIKASLYNILGMQVLEQNFFNRGDAFEDIVELQNIPKGIYILQLKRENEAVLQRKIWLK